MLLVVLLYLHVNVTDNVSGFAGCSIHAVITLLHLLVAVETNAKCSAAFSNYTHVVMHRLIQCECYTHSQSLGIGNKAFKNPCFCLEQAKTRKLSKAHEMRESL